MLNIAEWLNSAYTIHIIFVNFVCQRAMSHARWVVITPGFFPLLGNIPTTIPAATAVWGIVQRRIFFLYLAIGLIGAIILGIVTNMLIVYINHQ